MFPPITQNRSAIGNVNANKANSNAPTMMENFEQDRKRSSLLEGAGTDSNAKKKFKKGNGYIVDINRFRQLQGQTKVVNPYGTISDGLIGKDMLSEQEQKAVFMLKSNYNKNSSSEDNDIEASFNDSEKEHI